MKERGSPSPTVNLTHKEHSSPVPQPASHIKNIEQNPTLPKNLEKKTLIPQPVKINVSGYEFLSVENVRNANNPNEMKHYYQMEGENGKRLQVTIIEYGLNDPKRNEEPIPLRMDYGCPCMDMQQLAGHDCKKQRDLATEAMQKIGRGIMVLVNSEASAGMGYGPLEVWLQQRWLQDELHAGNQNPTVKEYFENRGVKNFDIRNHHEVAALISRRLETASYDENRTPLILLGSSHEKIKSLENGHNIPIADIARVIDIERIDRSKDYHNGGDVPESGVYLEVRDKDGETKLVLLSDIFSKYKKLIFEPRKRRKETVMRENEEVDFLSIPNLAMAGIH